MASIMRPPLSNSVQRLDNEIDDSIVVGEGDTVVRGETFLDARKLKADDALQDLITQRVVRDHGEPAKQRGGEHLSALAAGAPSQFHRHRALTPGPCTNS